MLVFWECPIQRSRKLQLPRKTTTFIFTVVFNVVASLPGAETHADQPCDLRAVSDQTKAIAKLAAFQDGLNFLAVSQSIAIIEIETGTPVWPIHVEESSFFGPLIGLRKFTDKIETYLNDLDKDIRRLASFDTFDKRYEEVRQANKILVDAGYSVLSLLDNDNTDGARRVLTSKTLPTLESVRGDIYTTISELETSVTREGLHCR